MFLKNLDNIAANLINPAPSKFGGGISLLWRGARLSTLNHIMFSANNTKNKQVNVGTYFFESARSAIYNCLISRGVGQGHEVIISSFTCEAVTYAVLLTGAVPVYVDVNDDLTMSDRDVLLAIGESTRAVIMQNTFGRRGLLLNTVKQLRKNNIFIIEDNALSVGSKVDGNLLGSDGDVSVWSLEVSKTVTIGWGGVVKTNNKKSQCLMAEHYDKLINISIFSDIRRIFQLWMSVLFTRTNFFIGPLIWYFFYGFRIFRRSNNFSNLHPGNNCKLGLISTRLLINLAPLLDYIFNKTNSNYLELHNEAFKFGLNKIIVTQRSNELIVSPRFSLGISENNINELIQYGKKNGVEIGRWFIDIPPKYGISQCKIHSFANAKRISDTIVNLPCHWTLTEQEVKKLKFVIAYIAAQK